MTRAALLLFAVLFAIAAGGVAGWWGRRVQEQVRLPPPRRRPPLLKDALRAQESGDAERLRRALTAFDGAAPARPEGREAEDREAEDRAEAALLAVRRDAHPRELERVARRFPGTDAAARAMWWAIQRLPPGEAQATLRRTFRHRWPQAWVLRGDPEAER